MEYKQPYSRFTPSAFLEKPKQESPFFEPVLETPLSVSPEFSTYALSKKLSQLNLPEEEPLDLYGRIITKAKRLVRKVCLSFRFPGADEQAIYDTLTKCVVRMVMSYLSSNPSANEDEVLVASLSVSVAVFGLDDAPECEYFKSQIRNYVLNELVPKSLQPIGIWGRIRKIQGDLLKLENYNPCKMEKGYLEEIQGCSRCQAITKQGKQCLRDAETNEEVCWQHS